MKKRSLVLVTVDCLRADHVGFMGYKRPVTPFLDSLASESVIFTQAIVAGAPTYFSFPAIVASRYPLALGRDVLGIAPNEPTIATALHDAGYATGAFLAGNPYLSNRFGYHQDFEHFEDFLDEALPADSEPLTYPANKRLSDFNRFLEVVSRRTRATSAAYDELYFWYCQRRSARQNLSMDRLRRYPAADVIVDRACAWLSNLPRKEQPSFLWLHLMDPHHPYYPPQEALSALGFSRITAQRARLLNSFWNRSDISPARLRRYKEEVVSLYDGGVHWADRQISRLVRFLQRQQRWDDTIFAITADHGEEFLEHGVRYHSPVNLSEPLIHVPLLIRTPEPRGTRIPLPFSLIHLAPTLLEAAGAAVPGSFQGRSVWEDISLAEPPRETVITECVEACNNPFQVEDRLRPRLMAVRDRNYKLVIHFGGRKEFLYELEHDPDERSPLPATAEMQVRARLLQAARQHLQKATRDRSADLALRARLREVQFHTVQRSRAATREPATASA